MSATVVCWAGPAAVAKGRDPGAVEGDGLAADWVQPAQAMAIRTPISPAEAVRVVIRTSGIDQ